MLKVQVAHVAHITLAQTTGAIHYLGQNSQLHPFIRTFLGLMVRAFNANQTGIANDKQHTYKILSFIGADYSSPIVRNWFFLYALWYISGGGGGAGGENVVGQSLNARGGIFIVHIPYPVPKIISPNPSSKSQIPSGSQGFGIWDLGLGFGNGNWNIGNCLRSVKDCMDVRR